MTGSYDKDEKAAMQEKERVTMGGKEIAQDDRQDMVQMSDIDLTWQIWRWDGFFQA